jgi:hypothetical protein
MKSYNGELGSARPLELLVIVRELTTQNNKELLRSEVPENIGNGEVWELPDFEEWQQIFGHVIGF